MSQPTLRAVLAGGILERARGVAGAAVRHLHRTFEDCSSELDTETEVIYRSNQTDTLQIQATVRTRDVQSAGAQALAAASAVSILLLKTYAPVDPRISAGDLRLDSQPRRTPEPAPAPAQAPAPSMRSLSRRHTSAEQDLRTGTVDTYAASIRRRRRRQRRR